EGGQTIHFWSSEFLNHRAMEPADVFSDRLKQFTYINHLGNIIGWYIAALFKDPPTVTLRKRGIAGEDAIPAAAAAQEKLASFQNDCDGAGRSFLDFWAQEVEKRKLLYGKAYVLFDLKKSNGLLSRAAQDQANALMPHLVAYSPQDVLNYDTDEQGNLTWILLKLRVSDQPNPFQPPILVDRWYLYTQTEYAVYECPLKQDDASNAVLDADNPYGPNAKVTLTDSGPHALADQAIVPVFVQKLHHDHWIANRIASPAIRLLNLENGYDWSLEVTNLALLILYSNEEINTVRRGEANFLKLAPADKCEFLEPSGRGFVASQDRISELREEIYRLAYLIDQGRSSSATSSHQSGISKEQDKMPARDVLSALGDRDRGALQQILQVAADRLELDVDVDVQGLDFSDRAELTELEVAERAMTIMPITSTTLERACLKRNARLLLPDANREQYDKIDEEIDSNPTPNE